MPYILPNDRHNMQAALNQLSTFTKNGGDIQYIIAWLVQDLLASKSAVRYADLEAIMGALSGAQQEFYREVVAPYEDKKMQDNGPVYNTNMYRSGGY